MLQVWRPLVGPVQDSPLAMIDVNSLAKDDYMSYTLYFPGRTGYNYTLHPDNYKSHRFANLTPNFIISRLPQPQT